MQVKIDLVFDLFELFVHDSECLPQVDEQWLASRLNEMASTMDTDQYLLFECPRDTGRRAWCVQYLYSSGVILEDLERLPHGRASNVREVKEMLPPLAVQLIETLNKMIMDTRTRSDGVAATRFQMTRQ